MMKTRYFLQQNDKICIICSQSCQINFVTVLRLHSLARQLEGRITRKMGHILTMISEKVSIVRQGQCLKFYTVKTAFFVH